MCLSGRGLADYWRYSALGGEEYRLEVPVSASVPIPVSSAVSIGQGTCSLEARVDKVVGLGRASTRAACNYSGVSFRVI